MKMKSTYEKPSEKKREFKQKILRRIKKLQKLKNRYKIIKNERFSYAIW